MKLSPILEDLFNWCKEHQSANHSDMPHNLYSRLAILRAAKAGRLKNNNTKFLPIYDKIAKDIGLPDLFDKPHKVTPQEVYNKHAQPIEDKRQAKYLKDAQELVQWIKANNKVPIASLTDKTQNRLASFMGRLINRKHPFPDHLARELAIPVISKFKKRKHRTNPA